MDDKTKIPTPDLDDEDEELPFLRGIEEPPAKGLIRRRRRGSGVQGGGGGIIVTTPSTLTATDTTPIGTTVGTISVLGGSGTYTFTLTDPSGRFTIVGNQLQTTSPLTAGFYNITINASNGLGDTPTLPTVVYVSHVGTYVPTYPYYGF